MGRRARAVGPSIAGLVALLSTSAATASGVPVPVEDGAHLRLVHAVPSSSITAVLDEAVALGVDGVVWAAGLTAAARPGPDCFPGGSAALARWVEEAARRGLTFSLVAPLDAVGADHTWVRAARDGDRPSEARLLGGVPDAAGWVRLDPTDASARAAAARAAEAWRPTGVAAIWGEAASWTASARAELQAGLGPIRWLSPERPWPVPEGRPGPEAAIDFARWLAGASTPLVDRAAGPRADAEALRAGLALRRAWPALGRGRARRLAVRGAAEAWERHDGVDRGLLVANRTLAPVSVELRWGRGEAPARLEWVDGLGPAVAERVLVPRGGRLRLELPPRALGLWKAPVDRRRLRVEFADDSRGAAAEGLETGRAWSAARGLGFDRARPIRCPARGPCGARFPPRAPYEPNPVEWTLELPPGPYEVRVELLRPHPKAAIEIEGEVVRGPRPRRLIMVRDGRLQIRGASAELGLGAAVVSAVSVTPAPRAPVEVRAEAAPDRVVIRASRAGVIEWRVDGATTEPVERTRLRAEGGGWTAVLGPWRAGAVHTVSWLYRGSDGVATAPGGREHELSVEAPPPGG